MAASLKIPAILLFHKMAIYSHCCENMSINNSVGSVVPRRWLQLVFDAQVRHRNWKLVSRSQTMRRVKQKSITVTKKNKELT